MCRDLTATYPTATADIAGYMAAIGGGDGLALSQARAGLVAPPAQTSPRRAARGSLGQFTAAVHRRHSAFPGQLRAQ
jgi:hypothetical protein